MVQPQLTPNTIASLYTLDDPAGQLGRPLVQVLSVKKLPSSNASSPERYRLILSDGTYYSQAMLATQANYLVQDNSIARDSVISLNRFVVNPVQGRKIVILLEVEVLGSVPKIGAPKNVEEDLQAGTLTAPPPLPPSSAMQQNTSGAVADAPAAGAGAGAGGAYNAYQNNRAPASPQARPTPVASSSAGAPGGDQVMPIDSLNPYNNRWTIKARVSNKSAVRTWTNQRGEGKLFSVNLIDDSGEIKATAFNDTVDRFFGVLEEGRVYYVSKAQVKMARKQYSNVQNDYELSFDNNTLVIPELGVRERKDFMAVDMIAVVKETGELSSVTAKTTQRQIPKRDVTLIDQSNTTVKLTLWNESAESFDGSAHPVLALKGVRVSDYGGRSLSTASTTSMTVNPDIPEAHALRGWFDTVGSTTEAQSISTTPSGGAAKMDDRKLIAQIKDENLGQSDKPDYFSVKASIVFIRQEGNIWYTACPGENCSKKVTQEGPLWRCEKCQRSYNYCDYRYILSMNVCDSSGNAWLQCFNDTAVQVMGRKAEELNQMKENDNDAAFKAVFEEATFNSFIFRLRAKMEMYQDERKVRLNVMSVQPINYVQESKHLADLIDQL